MIRIEGIPIVAARLAATLKSPKSIETPAEIRPQRARQSLSTRRSTIARVRRPRLNTRVCA
jgi:hypothetical protein